MKKNLLFVFIGLLLLSGIEACRKDENIAKDDSSSLIPPADWDDENDNEEDDKPEVKLPIEIDGAFSDWDALDESKLAVVESVEGADWDLINKMTIYATADYIWICLDFNEAGLDKSVDASMNIYMNSDNDASTGCAPTTEFSGADVDCLLQGYIFAAGKYISYNPTLYLFRGENGFVGWPSWDGVASGNVAEGAGVSGRYELRLNREAMVDLPIADTFTIALDIQQSWVTLGALPNAAGTGSAEKLIVTVK